MLTLVLLFAIAQPLQTLNLLNHACLCIKLCHHFVPGSELGVLTPLGPGRAKPSSPALRVRGLVSRVLVSATVPGPRTQAR